ncbi:MAG: hypothetical protein M1821_007590 [Bathelium mastoideum]|nr:MAG: hypothetical protein M1821_007590 [Bathelium mastoideum]KAI9677948.1 MAG: hypothetical protein M1822_008056 [Bathelium mastoideum]
MFPVARLPLFASAFSLVASTQQAQALAASPDGKHAVRSPAAAACQADCLQPSQQLTQQQLYWTQQSFATKITAATVIEVYNQVLDETRTIIQYDPNAPDFTTYTTNGVESTFLGEYTVTSVPYGAQQTSQTATYVATNGDTPTIETV